MSSTYYSTMISCTRTLSTSSGSSPVKILPSMSALQTPPLRSIAAATRLLSPTRGSTGTRMGSAMCGLARIVLSRMARMYPDLKRSCGGVRSSTEMSSGAMIVWWLGMGLVVGLVLCSPIGSETEIVGERRNSGTGVRECRPASFGMCTDVAFGHRGDCGWTRDMTVPLRFNLLLYVEIYRVRAPNARIQSMRRRVKTP
jgi:hypothetical protein